MKLLYLSRNTPSVVSISNPLQVDCSPRSDLSTIRGILKPTYTRELRQNQNIPSAENYNNCKFFTHLYNYFEFLVFSKDEFNAFWHLYMDDT